MFRILKRTILHRDLVIYTIAGLLGIMLSSRVYLEHLPEETAICCFLTLVCLICAVIQFWSRVKFARQFHFTTVTGVTVGWTDSRYSVKEHDVNRIINQLLVRAELSYGSLVYESINGALLLYREPTWIQDMGSVSLRTIAGEQDGYILQVGHHSDLSKTATAHEIAHLILNECVWPHPSEAIAHQLMKSKGWC